MGKRLRGAPLGILVRITEDIPWPGVTARLLVGTESKGVALFGVVAAGIEAKDAFKADVTGGLLLLKTRLRTPVSAGAVYGIPPKTMPLGTEEAGANLV